MRPIGEIRQLVLEQFDGLCGREHAGLTWRDVSGALVPHGVSPAAVEHTVWNLARAGVIARVGHRKVPDASRPLVVWRPSDEQRTEDQGAALWQAIRSWAEFV